MNKKTKKISLENIHKTLLMISGSITIVIGIVNQLIKLFQDYTKKATEYTSRMAEAMSPEQINSIHSFFSNNWQLMLIGLGIAVILFVVIFVKNKEK
jgi:hypothetical protein